MVFFDFLLHVLLVVAWGTTTTVVVAAAAGIFFIIGASLSRRSVKQVKLVFRV